MVDYSYAHRIIREDWLRAGEEIILMKNDWFLAMCDKQGNKRYELWHICNHRLGDLTKHSIFNYIAFMRNSDKRCYKCKTIPHGKILFMYRLLTMGNPINEYTNS